VNVLELNLALDRRSPCPPLHPLPRHERQTHTGVD
jgi:hypothetical protein